MPAQMPALSAVGWPLMHGSRVPDLTWPLLASVWLASGVIWLNGHHHRYCINRGSFIGVASNASGSAMALAIVNISLQC